MPAGLFQQEEGVASEIAHEAIAELARPVHEHGERLPDVLCGNVVGDHLRLVRPMLRLDLDNDEARERRQPIECREMLEVAAVHVDRQKVQPPLRQPSSFEYAREAVVAGVNERAFDGDGGIAGVVCFQVLELPGVAFDQQRGPALKNERARVGKNDAVPGAEFATEPVPRAYDLKDARNDVFLAVLRDALPPIVDEGFHLA